MYLNGMGFRGMSELKVCIILPSFMGQKLGEKLPDVPKEDIIPEVGELDELETFIGSKKTKFGFGQQ
jgi:hypothetical protein